MKPLAFAADARRTAMGLNRAATVEDDVTIVSGSLPDRH
jgi:hypothetical protein